MKPRDTGSRPPQHTDQQTGRSPAERCHTLTRSPAPFSPRPAHVRCWGLLSAPSRAASALRKTRNQVKDFKVTPSVHNNMRVVYRITADNSLNPKTRYNALISLSSVGALP